MRLIKKLLVLSTLSVALAATSAGVIAADAKPTIKIGYVEGWDDSVATSNVAAQIIEKKLGYPVQLVPVAAGEWAPHNRQRALRAVVDIRHLEFRTVRGGLAEPQGSLKTYQRYTQAESHHISDVPPGRLLS